MIHVEFAPSTILGIGLTMVGLVLYLLRKKQPSVSRDYDFFFSSIGLLSGGILMFQGWRLDPILLLSQLLSSGTAVFFIGESLWLRNQQNQQNDSKCINPAILVQKQNETDIFPCIHFSTSYKTLTVLDRKNEYNHCAKYKEVGLIFPLDYIDLSVYGSESFKINY